jgi:hypothetical protein
VPDAVDAELVHGLPDVVRGRVLAGVRGEPQTAQARHLVGAAVQARRVAPLRPRDVEAHDARALVQVLRLGQGLAREELRDVGSVLAHRDDDEAQLHPRVLPPSVVHPRQRRADRLAGGEPGIGVDERRVAQLEGVHTRGGGGEADLLDHLRDVLVELGHPQRVVHLVEVGEQSPLLALLDLQEPSHLRERVGRVEPVVAHQLPGHLGRDRAVHVLVQLHLRQGAQALFDLRGGRGRLGEEGVQGHARTLAWPPGRLP